MNEEDSNIKQVFILTHNVYLFKEITFSPHRKKNIHQKITYFIVKKHNGISEIKRYEDNPIKTTYQLLWENIKNEKNDSVSIQNNMRRIIEFYFKKLANISDEEIINHFTDTNEKIVCRSLIAWMNAGSHDVFDDIHIDSIQGCGVEQYQNIFKLIFERTNHLAHYNMMMNEPN
jgi:wobble nucleotide-excising tRNase